MIFSNLPCSFYPAAAHAHALSGVKQSGPSVCLSVCVFVCLSTKKIVLNVRYTALAASKEQKIVLTLRL